MAAVVEVGADARGAPWRGGEEVAEVHVVESDLAGARVRVEGAAECVGRTVELREIIACEDACARVGGRGADEARTFVASYFDVNFAGVERGDGAIEEAQLVLSRHPGDLVEDVRERAIGGMRRAGESARVGKLGPLRAASLEERIKLHVSGKCVQHHQYIAGPIGPTRPMPYGLNISSCSSISSICWASRFSRETSPSFAWNCLLSFNFSYC